MARPSKRDIITRLAYRSGQRYANAVTGVASERARLKAAFAAGYKSGVVATERRALRRSGDA